MDLYTKSFNIVSTVSPSGEVRQVELDLVPSFIESHGHSTDERLHSGGRLIVGGSESSSDIFIIENLHFESKVFLQLFSKVRMAPTRVSYIFDNHDQEGKLDAQGFFGISRGSDESSGNVGTHDFKDTGLDIGISESLDVTISD